MLHSQLLRSLFAVREPDGCGGGGGSAKLWYRVCVDVGMLAVTSTSASLVEVNFHAAPLTFCSHSRSGGATVRASDDCSRTVQPRSSLCRHLTRCEPRSIVCEGKDPPAWRPLGPTTTGSSEHDAYDRDERCGSWSFSDTGVLGSVVGSSMRTVSSVRFTCLVP